MWNRACACGAATPLLPFIICLFVFSLLSRMSRPLCLHATHLRALPNTLGSRMCRLDCLPPLLHCTWPWGCSQKRTVSGNRGWKTRVWQAQRASMGLAVCIHMAAVRMHACMHASRMALVLPHMLPHAFAQSTRCLRFVPGMWPAARQARSAPLSPSYHPHRIHSAPQIARPRTTRQ